MIPPSAQSVVKCVSRTGAATYSDTHCPTGSHASEIRSPAVNLADGMTSQDRIASLQQNSLIAQATLEQERQMATAAQITSQDTRCVYLAALIASLDAEARQPQMAYRQDWLRAQRRDARQQQFALRCQ